MILTLTIGVLIYSLGLITNRTVLTPDGSFYLAMGRGMHVPRPYALRTVAQLLPNVMAWRILHGVSYLVLAAMCHLFGERNGVDGTLVATGVLCLPTIRQSISWPVLLDIPLLAWVSSAAVLGQDSWLVGMMFVALGPLLHERASIWSAIYLLGELHWVLLLVAIFFAGCLYAHLLFTHEPHPDEQRIEWLREPFKSALRKHLPTVNNWRVWVQPWGLSVLGLAWGHVSMLPAIAFGYGGCLLAQDRARIIAPAGLLLVCGGVITAGEFAIAIPLVNYFTNTDEV